MKNQFDQQIKQTFEENLDNVHASDELKARLLARLSNETVEIPQKKVALTAIAPEFVYKHHTKKKSNVAWLVATLVSAALILISTTVINFYNKHTTVDETITPESKSEIFFEGNTSEQIARETATIKNQKKQIEQINYNRHQQLREQNSRNNHISYNSRARRI